MRLKDILTQAVERSASDILLVAGLPVSYKISGKIERVGNRLLPADTASLTAEAYAMTGGRSREKLNDTGDDDFSFALPGLSRFRVSALRQRGSLALIIRVVPFSLPDRAALGIPDNVMSFAGLSRGLVLVTGPAGSGKSTTLACLMDAINSTRSAHIVTIEDPIEFLHPHKESVVIQRELSIDTLSCDAALRAAVREAPDVILLSEMRDAAAIQGAISAAESGQLVLSTLHTVGAANTVERIVDSFPSRQQQQLRAQLSMVLEGVISQQLLPGAGNTMFPAFEVMRASNEIRTMIREARSRQIDDVIARSAAEGMILMDQSILQLVRDGAVSRAAAMRCAVDPDWLKKNLDA